MTTGTFTSTNALQTTLENVLSEHFGVRRMVTALVRRVFAYSSSFPIEELDVTLDDGTCLVLLLKDLSPNAERARAPARWVKPAFLYDPEREIEAYRMLLRHPQLGTATYYGAVASREMNRYWLLLERVSGVPLWQIGDLAVWEDAARWLARMHHRLLDGSSNPVRGRARWIWHDEAYYRRWMQRALRGVQREPTVAGSRLQQLLARPDVLIRRLTTLPQGFIHGEFYPSNVLVQDRGGAVRICPVDWEMAALGPRMMDLGALIAGAWTTDEQGTMVTAYRDVLIAEQGTAASRDEIQADLDACQLMQALQWLGWAEGWKPPPEHAKNWLGEAFRLADRLEL